MLKLRVNSFDEKKRVEHALELLVPGGVFTGVRLSDISRWRIGGVADFIVRPRTVEQLSGVLSWAHINGHSPVTIGETSNLLFSEEGLRAICVQIGSDLSNITIKGRTATAQAGIWVPRLARAIMQAGLTGAEHIAGIPGALGGVICMNGGSQRQSIGNSVDYVVSVDKRGEIKYRTKEQCRFDYRESVFKENREVIALAKFVFDYAENRHVVREEMLRILRSRRRKFPRKQPNCGSVFKSNPAMYEKCGSPGAIIESLGWKGAQLGGAQVSREHANFIVNNGNATSSDVRLLLSRIQRHVLDETGYKMEPEILYMNQYGRIESPIM